MMAKYIPTGILIQSGTDNLNPINCKDIMEVETQIIS